MVFGKLRQIELNLRFGSGEMGQPATGILIDGYDSILSAQGSEYRCFVQPKRVEDLMLEDILETMTGVSLDDVSQKLEGHVRVHGGMTRIGDRGLLRQMLEKIFVN